MTSNSQLNRLDDLLEELTLDPAARVIALALWQIGSKLEDIRIELTRLNETYEFAEGLGETEDEDDEDEGEDDR